MARRILLSATALRSVAAFGLAAAIANPALAQEVPAAAPDQAAAPADEPGVLTNETEVESGNNATTMDEVVVTGSRIRRPNLESAIPITSIGGDQLLETGRVNVGDALNDLPQLKSTFAQQNPALGVGIAGLNLLDLRGLGTIRTLVLVNGRRHVGSDILNNAVSVDINSIPDDLIERVDIVTGGNSAVYGSDAIAGVVNFVLRRDFDGLQVRGQAGVTQRGYGANGIASVMYGKNFNEGRGNVILQGQYSNQERIFGSDIPWLREQSGLFANDIDVSGSDGIPDFVFVRDVRSATINPNGLIPISQRPGAAAACGVGLSNGVTPGTAFTCPYIFTPSGQLVAETGSRFGSGPNGSFVGGNGSTTREGDLISVIPHNERYGINLLSHYEFAPALEAFVEAKWMHSKVRGNNAGPTFVQGPSTQFDSRNTFRLDNPFLDPAARTTLTNAILASGCNPSFTVVCNPTTGAGILTPAQITAINNGSYRFVLGRQFTDMGNRDEVFSRDTYRIVGGFRGNFNDDWNYEISANYGKFEEDTTTYGYVDRQRFLLSLDAGRNPATGQIQCRSQFDPAAAIQFPAGGTSQLGLAGDIAACVPYNPFGAADNSAAINYFQYNARHQASMSQLDFLGFVGGDSSQWFELPGGPVHFVVGGEYRQETATYHNDRYVEAGSTNAVVVGEFDPDDFDVKEAFAEVEVPILKDVPGFETLSLSAAGRVSGYGGAIGTVWTYNAGGEWSPVRDIRFRGNYGKAVRVPNSSETGFPVVPNFAPGFADPCRPAGLGVGSANRIANCQADLGPLLANLTDSTYSLPILSGSNPDLQPETSKSLTLGGVVQPRMIPGLSVSVDYWNIKVKNVIVSLAAQNIVNLCYDAPSLDNQFCSLFERWRGPGNSPGGFVPGQILENTLLSAGVNFASRVRKGVDIEAAYRTNISSDVRLDSHLIYTHMLKSSNYNDPGNPKFEDRILGELGDPVDEFRLDNDLSFGPITFGYRVRLIGPMWTSTYEAFNSLQGRPPENADFSDIRRTPTITYHDLRLEWNAKGLSPYLGKDSKFYVGVDNVFDQHAPLGLSGTGSLSGDRVTGGQAAIYDALGRRFYAGFRARY